MAQAGARAGPADPSWVAAIYRSATGGSPMGGGVCIDGDRVLTAGHLLEGLSSAEVWVGFPEAKPTTRVRRRVVEVVQPVEDIDAVLLQLAEPVPDGVRAAPLRCPSAQEMVDLRWWAYGFPGGSRLPDFGIQVHGSIAATSGWGRVHLETQSRYVVASGFSGAGVWSPDYAESVIGVLGWANERGDAQALSLDEIDRCMPGAKLRELARWSAAGDSGGDLAQWGWSLSTDPEGPRHWLPRARGVAIDTETGYRFRGRRAALDEVVAWLDRPTPDHRILVVTGSPGVGKSAVLGRIVTTADRTLRALLPREDRAVRASVGSVAVAVHAKGKAAIDVANEIATALSLRKPAGLPDLPHRLQRALHRSPRRFNVVIDALDEAAPGEARLIATDLVKPLVDTCAAVGVQVVVGTRRRDDAGDLRTLFGAGAKVVDLDEPEYFELADLEAYALACLTLVGSERPGSPYRPADPVTEGIARRIAGIADRNFLVAGLTAREHGLYDDRPVELEALGVTSDVRSALDRYLERIPPVATVGGGKAAGRKVLTALAYAEAPGFSARLWAVAIRTLYGMEVDEVSLWEFARSSAANFLIETSAFADARAFRLFHQALNDTLRSARRVPAHRDEAALAVAFHAEGQGRWQEAPDYLLLQLPVHAGRGRKLDLLLADYPYLLHADLVRLQQAAASATIGRDGQARLRLLRLTPEAARAGPGERAALFSLTNKVELLGIGEDLRHGRMPYAVRWADTPPRQEVASLEGHAGGANALCLVANGASAWLASGGDDGTVRVWDPEVGQLMMTLRGHAGEVTSVCAVTSAGVLAIVSGCQDGAVRFWDPDTGRLARTLPKGAGVDAPAITTLCSIDDPATAYVAAGDETGWVRVWDPATGRLRLRTRRAATPAAVTVLGHVRSRRTNALVAGWDDGLVGGWDLRTGRRIDLPGRRHEDAVTALCSYEADKGICIASTGSDGLVHLYLVDERRTVRGVTLVRNGIVARASAICSVTTSTGRVLVAGDEEGYVWTWSPRTGQLSRTFRADDAGVAALCAVRVGQAELLASTGSEGTIRLWDPTTGRLFGHPDAPSPGRRRARRGAPGDDHSSRPTGGFRARALALASRIVSVSSAHQGGETALIAGSADGTVRLRRPRDGTGPSEDTGRDLRTVCAVPVSGRARLVSGSSDGVLRVRIDPPANGRGRAPTSWSPLGRHRSGITCLSPLDAWDRSWLVSGSEDGVVRLWEATVSGADWHSQVVREHHASVTAMSVVQAADRRALIAADSDGTVHVREPQLRQGVWMQHSWETALAVTALCGVWSEGRRLVAVAAEDGTVTLCDVFSGQARRTLEGHLAAVTTVCEVGAGDERWLASGSIDRTVRLWDPHRGRSMWRLPLHTEVLSMASVGQLLVIGTETGVIAVWIRAPAPRGQQTPGRW